jgi:phosphoenolpyruvate synthase/pyruvate phosphate dikinase
MLQAGFPVPDGFAVTTDAFRETLGSDLAGRISRDLAALDTDDLAALEAASARLRLVVETTPLPADVADAIRDAYAALGDDVPVAVRSSACAEDSESASFAGQQETYLHVRGPDEVRRRIRDCWASFFSERALFYREKKGSLDDLGMAVVVQRMVEADLAGVLFTCDPVAGRRDRMVVEAVLGLGEAVVSGAVTPDHYVLKRDGRVRKAQVHAQPYKIVAGEGGGVEERELGEEGEARKVTDDVLAELARIGDDLEQRLGVPQDIEWAVQDGEIFVLQARPVTT